MKVTNSIRRCYDKQLDLNKKLRVKVDGIIGSNKEEGWHYVSRIKKQESYALKIETGKIEDPNNLDDFFACTIVVKNNREIKIAREKLVDRFFDIKAKRPPVETFTHKSPDSFPYDDLRLYVKLKYNDSLPPESSFNELSNITFEIQIRTFLQHAWDLTVHDLTYKSDEISWAKQRVAYQIKAMLEHAEISMDEIENIKESVMLTKSNKKIKQLNRVKTFLTHNWENEALPNDLVRLSDSICDLLKQLQTNISTLQTFLDKESDCGRGTKTLNLSPFLIILQTIINQNPQKINDFLFNQKSKDKIIIPSELDVHGITLNENKITHI